MAGAGNKQILRENAPNTGTSITKDGGMIAFSSGSGIEMITTLGAGRQIVLPVSEQYHDFNPVISPDGTRIAFVSNRAGANSVL
jgi:Tol biopolymer transport system component